MLKHCGCLIQGQLFRRWLVELGGNSTSNSWGLSVGSGTKIAASNAIWKEVSDCRLAALALALAWRCSLWSKKYIAPVTARPVLTTGAHCPVETISILANGQSLFWRPTNAVVWLSLIQHFWTVKVYFTPHKNYEARRDCNDWSWYSWVMEFSQSWDNLRVSQLENPSQRWRWRYHKKPQPFNRWEITNET